MITATKWLKAKCPICGRKFEYPEGGYKPPTCNKFDCAFTYSHPELNNKKKGGDAN